MGSFLNAFNNRRQQNWQNQFAETQEGNRVAQILEDRKFQERIQQLQHEMRMQELLEQNRLQTEREDKSWERGLDQWKREQDLAQRLRDEQFNMEWGPGGPKAMQLPQNQRMAPTKALEDEVKLRELQEKAKAFAEQDAFGGGDTIEGKMTDLNSLINEGGVDYNNEGLADKKNRIAKGDEHYGGFMRIGSTDRRDEVKKMSNRVIELLTEVSQMDPRYVTPQQKQQIGAATAQLNADEIRQIYSISGITDDEAIGDDILNDMKAGEIDPVHARIIINKLGLK